MIPVVPGGVANHPAPAEPEGWLIVGLGIVLIAIFALRRQER